MNVQAAPARMEGRAQMPIIPTLASVALHFREHHVKLVIFLKLFIFSFNLKITLFTRKYFTDCDGPWNQPDGWTRGDPVIYQHFQYETGLTLNSGAQIAQGRVGCTLDVINMLIICL